MKTLAEKPITKKEQALLTKLEKLVQSAHESKLGFLVDNDGNIHLMRCDDNDNIEIDIDYSIGSADAFATFTCSF